MVFFTSILIVAILYFLQADGLIYVTVIALTAELVNIFLTHTVAKSVEKKLVGRHRRSVQGYIKRIKANKATINKLEKSQEEAGTKLYKANTRIKELEEQLSTLSQGAMVQAPPPITPEPGTPAQEKADPPPLEPEKPHIHDHLPDGSKRNATPS